MLLSKNIPSLFFIPVAGRLCGVELENFMCHTHLKLSFDVDNFNCFYITGPNGSGKSAIFAGVNITLGGAGRTNDRGKNIHDYVKDGARFVQCMLTSAGARNF
jgi:chromosome segregation ATPase